MYRQMTVEDINMRYVATHGSGGVKEGSSKDEL